MGVRSLPVPNAHHQPPKWDSLDWSVQLQLLRRGGLKSKPPLTTEQVISQIEATRAAVKDKQAENVADGKRVKNLGRRSGAPTDEAPNSGLVEEAADGSKVGQAQRLHGHWIDGPDFGFYQDKDVDRPQKVADVSCCTVWLGN